MHYKAKLSGFVKGFSGQIGLVVPQNSFLETYSCSVYRNIIKVNALTRESQEVVW